MKKLLLLSSLSMCMLSANALDYGTTPETAQPLPAMGWFLPSMDGAPAEAYFTYTNTGTAPVLFGSGPTATGRQIYVYLCNDCQTEAFQMTEGSDSYILLPGREYIVKVLPKAAGTFCMGPYMALPASWEGARKYYPLSIANEYNPWGAAQKISKGDTKWFLVNAPYASKLTAKNIATLQTETNISNVEMIHIECPGGTNTSTSFEVAGITMVDMPYFKAGANIFGVTATEDINVTFNADGYSILNCGNNLLRGQALTLDNEETYPDAYYTVDRYFKVPEDGTYTFFNHGAKGTILNVGRITLTDPDNAYKYECDAEYLQSATVGNDDAAIAIDLKKDDMILVQSDAFGQIGEGLLNQPYLKVVKGNQAGINAVTDDEDSIEVTVAGKSVTVSSVVLAGGAEVAVYDMQARKITSARTAAGADTITLNLNANPGIYMVVVYGNGNSESAKFVIK